MVRRSRDFRLKANVHAFTFSPDGGLLAAASGSYDGNATAHAYLWDASDGHEVSRLRHRGTVFQATFSPDGKRLATASHDKTAALWDVSTLGKIASLQHQGTVFSVDFSSDGSRLVTSTSFTDRLWDAANHHELLRVKVKRGWHISTLSPDSKRLVNLSEHEGGRLSDMSDGGLIRRLSHRGAHQTAFSPDGSRFVTTGGGRSIMWDSETGHEVRRLEREAKLLEAGTRATWFAAQSKDGILQALERNRRTRARTTAARRLSNPPGHRTRCKLRCRRGNRRWQTALCDCGASYPMDLRADLTGPRRRPFPYRSGRSDHPRRRGVVGLLAHRGRGRQTVAGARLRQHGEHAGPLKGSKCNRSYRPCEEVA